MYNTMEHQSISDKTDTNPNPRPSSLRANSTKRPMFGCKGKSLSFEDKICTVIPNDSVFLQNESDPEDEGRMCFSSFESRWWEPDGDRNWVQYCMNTSIHGLKYLGESKRHICERLFWVLAFGISCFTASYLINSVWLKYSQSPVVITFQPFETFVEQVPFPAVTICNMNKVLKSKAEEYMRAAMGPESDPKTVEAWKNVYYLDHVCSTSNKPFSATFNYTSTQGTVDPTILQLASNKITTSDKDVEDVAEFLQKASQPCSDMMKLCLWQGNVYDCSELFRPIETNFGKCCTFNMVPQTLLHRYMDDARDAPQDISDWNEWTSMSELVSKGDLSSRKKFPRVQNRAGKVSGLAFLVDPDLEEYFCTASDSTGFRLATHLSTDVPHVTDFGLAIRPNYEHFVSVRPEITLADDVIEGISIEKRNCYMDGEFRLNYYNYYTSSNCMDECIANLTYEACNCVRYYMPRDHNRAICGPAKYQCAEDVKQKSFNLGVKNICQNCLPTCTEIKYFADATSTPFRRRVDLWADEYNKSTSWAKSNISIIHVYFGQDSSYARVRSQLYGFSDLVANFGGIMGLMCGFSGLSFIELIYFFTLRVWFRQRRKRHLRRKKELREAAERDRETALAYLGVGLSSSRRASIESARSNANNSISFKPISLVANSVNEKDVDSLSSGYVSNNSPTNMTNLTDNNGDEVVAVSKF